MVCGSKHRDDTIPAEQTGRHLGLKIKIVSLTLFNRACYIAWHAGCGVFNKQPCSVNPCPMYPCGRLCNIYNADYFITSPISDRYYIILTTICRIIRRLRLFVRDFLVSYRIRSAMKFPQNVLHYI